MSRDVDAVLRDLYDLLDGDQADLVRGRVRSMLGLPSRAAADDSIIFVDGGAMPAPAGWPVWGNRWIDNFRQTGIILYACKAAGISRETYQLYGVRKTSKYYCAAFHEAVLDAEDEVTDVFLGKLYELALAGNFKAILAILRARRPDEWVAKRRTEVSGPGGGPIPHEHVHALREQLRNRILPSPDADPEDALSG